MTNYKILRKPSYLTKLKKQKLYLVLLKAELVNNVLFTYQEKTELTKIYNELIAKYEILIKNKIKNIDVYIKYINL